MALSFAGSSLGDSLGINLGTVPLQVPDEESSQTKALNFLWLSRKGRDAGPAIAGYIEPDMAHPRWNSFKRSCTEVGLYGAILKGTVITNHATGPWMSGANRSIREEAIGLMLETVDDEWLAERAESMLADQSKVAPDDLADRSRAELLEFWQNAGKNLGSFVKNKIWFGCLSAFETLVESWTQEYEIARAVMHFSGSLQQGQGDQHDESDEADEEEAQAEPTTRKEMNQLRSRYNTAQLCWTFLQDRYLQQRLRVVCAGGRCLQLAYVSSLDLMCEGPTGFLKHAALRTAGEWYTTTVSSLLELNHDSGLATRLGLLPRMRTPLDVDVSWVRQDVEVAQMLMDFTVSLASNEAWSQIMFTMCFPHCVAYVAHSDPAERQRGMNYMRLLTEACLSAEQLVRVQPVKYGALKALLDCASFLQEQFPRELMASAKQQNYDPDSRELQQTAMLMFQGFETAHE